MLNLDELIHKIKTDGPTRVLVNQIGEAETPAKAKRVHDITPDVVYIRNDGWSLGTPENLAQKAQEIWEGSWIGYIRIKKRENEK